MMQTRDYVAPTWRQLQQMHLDVSVTDLPEAVVQAVSARRTQRPVIAAGSGEAGRNRISALWRQREGWVATVNAGGSAI